MQMRQNDVKLLSILCTALMITCVVGIIFDSNESDAVTDLGTYSGGTNQSSSNAAYSTVNLQVTSESGRGEIYVLIGSQFTVTTTYLDSLNWDFVTNDPSIILDDGGLLGASSLRGTVSQTGIVATVENRNNGSAYTFIGIEDTTPVSSISISGTSSVDVGGSVSLRASVSPSNADDTSVTWSIESGSSYGYLSSYSSNPTTFYAQSSGYVTIRATANDGSGVYDEYEIYINDPSQYWYAYLNFSANGGSGAPGQMSDSQWGISPSGSAPFRIPSTEPTRNGYTFLGWSTSSSASSPSYEAGDYFYVDYDDSDTLYAVWEKNPTIFTLNYNGNATGVSNVPFSQTYSSTTATSHTFTINSTAPTRSGYDFDGWYTNSSCTGTKYSPGGTISVSSTTTLYAKWVATPVEIESSQGDVSLITGSPFSYVVSTNLSGCTISVSGASWLSVSGNTVSGTPISSGTFTVTITASLSGHTSDTQTFTISVVSQLAYTNSPSNGVAAVEV